MKKLIIANWKLNPSSVKEAVSLAKKIDAENLVICPPFPFIAEVGKAIKKSALGAQDLFWEDKGAFTGQVAGAQLKSLGVKYVIIGHSERRRLGDTDEAIAKKVAAALRNGIIPILCVGETAKEHKSGKSKEVIKRQLKIGLSLIGNWKLPARLDFVHAKSGGEIGNLCIAYEPVWAISTEPGAKPDTPENAVEMSSFIRGIVSSVISHQSLVILYGGSVTSKNAASFLKHKEIEGALVGGASLKPADILEIVKTANLS